MSTVLRRAREEVPYTCTEAARLLGLSGSALRMIEEGVRKPGWDTIGRMVELYKVDPRRLFPADWARAHNGEFGAVLMCRELGLSGDEACRFLAQIYWLRQDNGAYFADAIRAFFPGDPDLYLTGCSPLDICTCRGMNQFLRGAKCPACGLTNEERNALRALRMDNMHNKKGG